MVKRLILGFIMMIVGLGVVFLSDDLSVQSKGLSLILTGIMYHIVVLVYDIGCMKYGKSLDDDD